MIIITTYQQVELVRENIANFRNNFKGYFSTCPIVIIPSSEQEVGFNKLPKEFENVHVINFFDAPGSANCTWYDFQDPNRRPINWHHAFLPPRIFMSIEKGLHKAV